MSELSAPKKAPIRVNPFLYDEDKLVLYHAAMGKSLRHSMETTSLTKRQIAYRCKKFEVKRSDYRNGVSAFSQALERMGRTAFEHYVMRQIKKLYEH